MIELFDCRRELYTATEAVAGNSLFHVVVSHGTAAAAVAPPAVAAAAVAPPAVAAAAAAATTAVPFLSPPLSPAACLVCHAHPSPNAPPRHPHPPPQVDSDDVALRLTDELNRGKCGRVSFMPLNRLNPGQVQYPEQASAGGTRVQQPAMADGGVVCGVLWCAVVVLRRAHLRSAEQLVNLNAAPLAAACTSHATCSHPLRPVLLLSHAAPISAPRLTLCPPTPAPSSFAQFGNDAVPLLRRLKYDQKFDPAFRQVGCRCCCHRRSQCVHAAVAHACNALLLPMRVRCCRCRCCWWWWCCCCSADRCPADVLAHLDGRRKRRPCCSPDHLPHILVLPLLPPHSLSPPSSPLPSLPPSSPLPSLPHSSPLPSLPPSLPPSLSPPLFPPSLRSLARPLCAAAWTWRPRWRAKPTSTA